MSKPLLEVVLPNLARRLQTQLQRYQSGQLNDEQFARRFAQLLQKQFVWLARHGMAETEAALTVHAAVLILSRPGLQIEAAQRGVPLEVIERQAVRAAAADLAQHYEVDTFTAYSAIADVIAQYGE